MCPLDLSWILTRIQKVVTPIDKSKQASVGVDLGPDVLEGRETRVDRAERHLNPSATTQNIPTKGAYMRDCLRIKQIIRSRLDSVRHLVLQIEFADSLEAQE